MPTRVLGILGSPRVGGNSETLLERVLAGARSVGAEVQSLNVAELEIEGCRECEKCKSTGLCVVEDDMRRVMPMLLRAHVVVIATPVFFYGFPSQLKALVDRCQPQWHKRHRAKKTDGQKDSLSGTGYLVAVGGGKRDDLFRGMMLSARSFFDVLDLRFAGDLFVREVEEKGGIRDRPEVIEEAFELGRSIAKKEDRPPTSD
jgi:multimeric flavodoxin WrbA